MNKKQPKIARTYRLDQSSIDNIQKIRDSFMNQNMQLSSDSAVITYALHVAHDLCKSVDDGYTKLYIKDNDLRALLELYEQSTNTTLKKAVSSESIKNIKWTLQ